MFLLFQSVCSCKRRRIDLRSGDRYNYRLSLLEIQFEKSRIEEVLLVLEASAKFLLIHHPIIPVRCMDVVTWCIYLDIEIGESII